jgi:hypothetical protein
MLLDARLAVHLVSLGTRLAHALRDACRPAPAATQHIIATIGGTHPPMSSCWFMATLLTVRDLRHGAALSRRLDDPLTLATLPTRQRSASHAGRIQSADCRPPPERRGRTSRVNYDAWRDASTRIRCAPA